MDLSVQRQQVTHSLRRLDLSLERLIDALAHRPAWMTLEATTDERSAVRQACEAYAAISYAMDDPTPTSLVCLGVIGVPADIVQRAKAVNAAKAALKKVCADHVIKRARLHHATASARVSFCCPALCFERR